MEDSEKRPASSSSDASVQDPRERDTGRLRDPTSKAPITLRPRVLVNFAALRDDALLVRMCRISMPPPLSEGIVEYADGTPATVDQMSMDVSAFLMWTAEPKMADRKAAGARNFIFVGLLAVLLYLTNKKLWANVKKKKAA